MNWLILVLTFLVGLMAGLCLAWFWLDRKIRDRGTEDEEAWQKRLDHANAEVRRADAAHEETKQRLVEATLNPQDGIAASTTDPSDPSNNAGVTPSTSAPILPPSMANPDNLKKIKGIGKVLQDKLNALGITTFAQIAALSESEIERIDEVLDFKGRVARENWVEQAKQLAARSS